MQFPKTRRQRLLLTGKRNPEQYPHALQFYKYVPELSVSLEEFEKLALDRLQVLRIVERLGTKHPKNSQEYQTSMYGELRKSKLNVYKMTGDESCMTDEAYDERKKDHISHYILRLAYCKSEALRSWFLTQEVDLFRFRYSGENQTNKKRFMELNQMDYKPISKEEKEKYFRKLIACQFKISASYVENEQYYKVPFTDVLELVRNRKVYVNEGYAYIPEKDLVSLVSSEYRSHLSQALALTARILPQLEGDRRIFNIINSIHNRYIGNDYSKKKINFGGDVIPEMLDDLSKISFPLCMKTLHDSLRKSHHLKYFGRLQYGLFLKGIGVSMEDSMRFWREEFSKHMDMDKFDRQYAYGIRYNYGKEGKRANFTPYSCSKIILTNPPGAADCHGCPYKHSDTSNLRQMLNNLKIESSSISSILDYSSKGHYQLACTRHFEVMHDGATIDTAINHPNQYFEESRKIRQGAVTKRSGGQVTTTKTVVYSKSEDSKSQKAEESFQDDIEMADMEDFLNGNLNNY